MNLVCVLFPFVVVYKYFNTVGNILYNALCILARHVKEISQFPLHLFCLMAVLTSASLGHNRAH